LGVYVIIEKESLMDVVTGLSGSGPAYVFLVIQSLADGGVRMGLDRRTATILAAQTVLGSAKMVMENIGKIHPEELKDMVMSPGGTTAEGISVLEENKVRYAFIKAVEEATKKNHKNYPHKTMNLQEIINNLFSKSLRRPSVAILYRILLNWDEIAGNFFSKHAIPYKFFCKKFRIIPSM